MQKFNYESPIDRALIQGAIEEHVQNIMSALIQVGLTPEQAGKAVRHCTHRLEHSND